MSDGEVPLKVTPRTMPHGHFWEVHISPGFILRWEHADVRGGMFVFDFEDLVSMPGESRAGFGLDLLEVDKVREALRLWAAFHDDMQKQREEI